MDDGLCSYEGNGCFPAYGIVAHKKELVMIFTLSAIVGGFISACSGIAAAGGGMVAAGAVSAGAAATGAVGAIGAGMAAKTLLAGSAKHAAASALKGAVMKISATHVIKEAGESFVKNVFCDIVKPVVGSVLKCDLAGGTVSHTGIYIGNDRIVEVTEINHQAKVRIVNPREFLSGDGLLRTGVYIYIAAAKGSDGKYTAIHSASIAQRALMALGSRGKYSLVSNNCHMFTRYCINGENDDSPVWSADSLLGELERGLGVSGAVWRSTGVGSCNASFI